MVSSAASSVSDYLAELDPARRSEVEKVRNLVLSELPPGLEETMGFGMIVYQVPKAVVPVTYNGQPLMFGAIAAQKNYISLYLMSIYAWDSVREKFETDWLASGKKLNVGKSCIRFNSFNDLPVEVVKEAVGAISMEKFVERYFEVRGSARKMKVQG